MAIKQFHESLDEMERILREETVGYLGLSMNDRPYVVPLNYGYVTGRILFHCALKGKKLDYIKANPWVCFTVGRQFEAVVRHPQGAQCHVNHDSVICHGIAHMIDEIEARWEMLNIFNRCLQPHAEDITPEAAASCCAVEIKIAEMTGRQQRDGKHTYWHYSFGEVT